jgi:uncharacterized phiE125 gp8 family phage protein
VKTHLRVTTDLEDTLLSTLITAARRGVEAHTERALVSQTWTLKLDAFPDVICVPMPPLSSVSSITYIDTAGDSQTLASSVYTTDTDSEPGRIFLAEDQSWPTTNARRQAVTVTFVAGYGAATAVPEDIKAAILLTVGHLYANREAVVVGTIASELPMGVRSLLSPLRVPEYP